MSKQTTFLLGVFACWLSVFLFPAQAAHKSTAREAEDASSYIIRPGKEFTADSYIYTKLAPDAEIDPLSGVYVADLVKQIAEHYGHADVNIHAYAPPVYIVPAKQPTIEVVPFRPENPSFDNQLLRKKLKNVPLPNHFQPAAGTDSEVVIYQPESGKYWEFWRLAKTGRVTKDARGAPVEEWGAAWGGSIEDLSRNPGYFMTERSHKFGTQATGLPFIAGILSIAEQQRGRIEHMLQFSIVKARAGVWTWPAQRSDGFTNSVEAIPEGSVFRLPADLDLDALPMDSYARMLARAVQTYGMIVSDQSGGVGFRAENPGTQYREDPYTKVGGILKCPTPPVAGQAPQECWPITRLRGFPWDKLVVLKGGPNKESLGRR